MDIVLDNAGMHMPNVLVADRQITVHGTITVILILHSSE